MADAAPAPEATEDLATLGVEFLNKGGDELGKSMDANTQKAAKLESATDSLKAATSDLSTYNYGAKGATEELGKAFDASSKSATGLSAWLLKAGENLVSYGNGAKEFNSTMLDSSKSTEQATSALEEHGKISGAVKEALGEIQEKAKEVGGAFKELAKGNLDGFFDKITEAASGFSVTLGLMVGALTLVIKEGLEYTKALNEMDNVAKGAAASAGLTGEALDKLARQAAEASSQSLKASREQITAYASAGVEGADTLETLSSITKDYAELTGVKAADATKELANALKDPAKGVDVLNSSLGLLDNTTTEYVKRLAEAGDKEGAVKIITDKLKESVESASLKTDGWSAALQQLSRWATTARGALHDLDNAVLGLHVNANGDIDYKQRDAAVKAAQDKEDERQRNKRTNDALNAGQSVTNSLNLGTQKQYNDLLGDQAILLKAVGVAGASNHPVSQQMSHDLDAVTHAVQTYLPPAQKAHEIALAQAKLASIDPRDRAAKALATSLLEQAKAHGEVATKAELDERASDAAMIAGAKFVRQAKERKGATDKSADSLARDAAALLANIAGEQAMAEAVGQSITAEIIANATREASVKAIEKKMNATQAATLLEGDIQLALAKTIVTETKAAQAALDKAKQTEIANNLVADGSMTQQQANKAVSDGLTLQNLIDVREASTGKNRDNATIALDKFVDAQIRTNKAAKDAVSIASDKQYDQQIAAINVQIADIGELTAKREIDIAVLKEQQRLASLPTGAVTQENDPVEYNKRIANVVALTQKQIELNEKTKAYADVLQINDQALSDLRTQGKNAASDLATAFGAVGQAIQGMTDALSNYATNQEKVDDNTQKEFENATVRLKYAKNQEEVDAASQAQTDALAHGRQASAVLQVKAYGDMTTAGQKFFKQGTLGYEALGVATKAFRAIEFALSIKALATDIAHTAKWLFNSGLRAAANGVEAVTKALASVPFPLNIAAGAATAAAVIALGVSLAGGGGGASAATATAPEPVAGTGTVLGSPNDKSDSIAKSLDQAQKAQNKDLEYSNQMVTSLKSIDANIQNLTGALAKTLNVSGGALSTSGVNVGTSASGNFLFGSTKSTELVDNGIAFGQQKLSDIVNNAGIAAASYVASKTTKSNSFLGIGLGSSTSGKTTTQGLDSDLQNQITSVIKSLRSGVLEAAKTLGLDGAEATLNAFNVNLGKVSFKDLDAQGIKDELDAVFGKLGDQLATSVLGDVSKYQQAGEGALETLTRVARGYQVVDVSLDSIGKTFGAVGSSSIDARERLIDLSGGIDNFASQTSEFQQDFLSEAEQIAPVQKAVSDALASLGESSITTKEQFKNLVLGLDLTTDQGATMYAQLVNIAPAFAKVTDYTDKLNGVVDNASNAIDIANKKRSLEITLMQTTGDAAGALAAQRADELKTLDPSLRALQQQIYAAQDATTANNALAQAQADAAKIAEQAGSLQIQLLQAQGDATGAITLQRQKDLAALNDNSLKSIQEQIYAAQDAATAQQALADAQKNAADAAAQLADQTTALQVQLLQAKGDTAGATALQRKTDLSKLDPSLQALQQAIYDATDAAEANATAVKAATDAASAYDDAVKQAQTAVSDAQNVVSEAYKAQADAINSTIDQFQKLEDSLTQYMQQLNTGPEANLSPEQQYTAEKELFKSTAQAAKNGDIDAIGQLQSVSEDYLKASKDYFASSQGYFDDLSAVKDAVASSADAAKDQVSAAQAQLNALNASVNGIVTLNTSVLSVKDALADYQKTIETAFNVVNKVPANDNTTTSAAIDNQGYGAFFNNGNDQGYNEAQGSASAERSAGLSRGLPSTQGKGYDLVNGLVYGPNGGLSQYDSNDAAISALGLVKDGILYDRTIGDPTSVPQSNQPQVQPSPSPVAANFNGDSDNKMLALLTSIDQKLASGNTLTQAVAQQNNAQFGDLSNKLDKQNRVIARTA